MKSIYTIAVILSLMFCCSVNAQDMEDYMVVDELDTLKYELRLQRYIYKEKYIFEGEAINQYLLHSIFKIIDISLLISKKCCIFAPAIPRRGCLHVIGWGSRHI